MMSPQVATWRGSSATIPTFDLSASLGVDAMVDRLRLVTRSSACRSGGEDAVFIVDSVVTSTRDTCETQPRQKA